jgi:hypothetical protein
MSEKKCTCGFKRKVFCSNCSNVKMSILLKNGQKHLKIKNGNRNENPVWYSPLKYNGQSPLKIAEKLVRAFHKQIEYQGAANCLFITHNQSNYKINQIKL